MTREQMLIAELKQLQNSLDDKAKQRIWEIQTELSIIAERKQNGR